MHTDEFCAHVPDQLRPAVYHAKYDVDLVDNLSASAVPGLPTIWHGICSLVAHAHV
jgi:hypothetical protein